jgi:DNA mismatch repair protein MutL
VSKIIKLDKKLTNQIAAWEVVERPVSIIKELVENSIDAGSFNIKIEIESWWIDRIIITDNGEWIKKEELYLSLEKYSTSKIKSLEDLYNVMTFWFRWEALASISSVSNFEIISKIKDCLLWYSIKIKNNEIWKINEKQANTWTKVIVEKLFFNTPARLNYLKKPRTEYNHILDFLNNISLCYHNVWFEFVSDNKKIFKYNSDEKIETRIYNIYWEKFLDNLINIDLSLSGFEINWYITNPKISYPSRKRQTIFVNNRIVNSPLIYRAIMNSYNRFIPSKTFPWFILNIKLDPTQVDVNVHPRKQEIRFANESTIFRWIYNAIENKLNSVNIITSSPTHISQVDVNNDIIYPVKWKISERQIKVDIEKKENYYTWSWKKFKSYSPYKDIRSNPAQWNIKDAIDFSKDLLSWDFKKDNSRQSFGEQWNLHYTPMWKIIWQIYYSYILVETKEWIKILDQHALAERIIYEKLIKKDYKTKIQKLLFQDSFNLLAKELSILEDSKEVFKSMWFDFEIMSNNIVILNWIPDFIKKENFKKIFLGILEDIWEEKFNKSKTLQEVKNKIFAYTACRSAIKFWNKLNLFEMNKLLNDSLLDYSITCPHWRPVIFEIWLNELKGKYNR